MPECYVAGEHYRFLVFPPQATSRLTDLTTTAETSEWTIE